MSIRLLTSGIFHILVPIVIILLGVYLHNTYHKTKKEVFWWGFFIGFGAGWLLLGFKWFLVDLPWLRG